MYKHIIPKHTIYERARGEGNWDIKYGEAGISFPFFAYEDVKNTSIVFNFSKSKYAYEVSRHVLKKFYAENPQIKIIKFDTIRMLIPMSICEKIS